MGSFVFFLGSFSACTKEKGSLEEITISPADTVFFQSQIKPLLDTKCGSSGCHGAGSSRNLYTNHSEASSRKSAINNRVVVLKDMPAGGRTMSADERQLFANWIAQGALDN